MNTRQGNDITDHIVMAYTKIETELSWPMGQDVIYYKKQTGQRCDW